MNRTMKIFRLCVVTTVVVAIAGVCTLTAQVQNTNQPYYYAYPPGGAINSQLYVNGQTTGLSGFHGRVGYFPANQLRLDLPSAQQGGFRRQSVGLPDVMAGNVYTASPYYEPSSTALSLRGIQAGLNVPGGNAPIGDGRISASIAEQLYINAMVPYRSIIVPGQVQVQQGVAAQTAPGGAANIYQVQPLSMPLGPLPSAKPMPETKEGFSRQLYEFYKREASIDQSVKGEVSAGVGAAIEAQVQGAPKPEAPKPMEQTPAPKAAAQPSPAEAAPQPAAKPSVPEMPAPDEDVYVDILTRLQQRGQLAAPGEAKATPSPVQAFPLDESSEDISIEPKTTAKPSADMAPRIARLVELAPDNQIVIHSLVGQKTDMFNVCMAKGQDLLKEGKYYESAGQFNVAGVVRPTNPLARIGRGLALFAAGEPYSAAINVRRGLEFFPPIMETRLDLVAIMNRADAVLRLKHLDDQLDQQGKTADPDLVFLAAFMHQNLQDPTGAAKYARQLQLSAGSDVLLNAYATFILTGKRPSEIAPSPGPASAPSTP